MRYTQYYCRTGLFAFVLLALVGFALFVAPAASGKAKPDSVAGTTYYVDGDAGDDNNAGLSEADAFQTLNHAVSVTNPGDTVLVMNGIYLGEGNSTATLRINRAGTPDNWITYRAYPGHKPLIQSNGAWQAVRIEASYIVVDGFEIRGIRDQVPFAEAEAAFNNFRYNDAGMIPRVHGTGIQLSAFNIVRNNVVHNFGGSGIEVEDIDSVIVEGNTVYDNSHYSPMGHSGISVHRPENVDNASLGLEGTKYKIIVRGNISHSNYNLFPCGCFNYEKATDGNGIIIDQSVGYDGWTLVANNVTFNNGGSGIHTYRTRNVDIINNTSYQNAQHPDIEGDLYARRSENVNIINNIIYARPGERVTSDNGGTNITYAYNIYYDGSDSPILPTALGEGDLIAQPKFYNPSLDPNEADFRISSSSAAIDSGADNYLPMTDIRGVVRVGGQIDRGAYENSSGNDPQPTTPVPGTTPLPEAMEPQVYLPLLQ